MIEAFVAGRERIAVVGLGYVGISLFAAFGRHYRGIIGFDLNEGRIEELRSGLDSTGEVDSASLRMISAEYTTDSGRLKEASVIIIAVPTPLDSCKNPDLRPIISASETVGRNMSKGTVVVYESTVYPGLTEEICLPVLERSSGMRAGSDFRIGYSPERINPGDRVHTVEKIVKIVSSQDPETTEFLAALYGKVIEAGVHRAGSIAVAEASKIIENIQRDLNIALINELAMIFHRLGIDTKEVLDAARTKWNFIPLEPGLVGGHCIGVDPTYLTFKAQEVGFYPEVILAGRRTNESMGQYIAEQTVKNLLKAGSSPCESKVLLLGFTFKEDVSDIRNTKVIDVLNSLAEYCVKTFIYDPVADRRKAESEYGVKLIERPEDFAPYDCIVASVKHSCFRSLSPGYLRSLCLPDPVMIDVKSFLDAEEIKAAGFRYWRL